MTSVTGPELRKNLSRQGFVLLKGVHDFKRRFLDTMPNSFKQFQSSWNNLPPDPYLRDGGHYRLRRYSVFNWKAGKLSVLPHEAHFQSNRYNPLHGGYYRDYRDWTLPSQHSAVLKSAINWNIHLFSPLARQGWRIQAHQFRIKADHSEKGKPTPEGIHKDGANYIFIMLLNRQNVAGGTSRLYDNDRNLITEALLEKPGDAILLNDEAVWHSVSPITPVDKNKIAYRDVLVLTFHRE